MYKFFNTISRNLIFFISASMFLGFMYGLILPADFLKSFIIPCVFFIVYPMMVGLKVEEVFKGNDVKLQLSTQFINFCVIPFISFGIGLIFFKNHPYMLLGILLIGLLPSGVATISWTGLSKGNVESAIKMVTIGSVLGVILAPFYIKFLIGPSLDIDIDLFALIKQIISIIILPMLFGVLTRRLLLIKYTEKDSKEDLISLFPLFSTIGIIGIVFIAMALKAKNVIQNPMMFVYILFPIALLYFFNFTLSILVGRLFFNRVNTITLVYGSSMRNLSIALAIAMNLFDGNGSDAALVITVAYIIQVQSAAWYSKLISHKITPTLCTADASAKHNK